MLPQYKAGRVAAAAVTGTEKSPALPDVSTAGSQGVKGLEATTWYSLMAPAGVPAAVIERLQPALQQVLTNPDLRAMWEQELTEMRERIHALRHGLVEKLAAAGAPQFGFINEQAGMFSYSGLSREQVERLRDEFGIYAVGTGRICVAALNQNNLEYVAKAVATVAKG
ncbi:hypothetical protein G6F57_019877 [Rhizopus arrhizus]|nr:hypothetical protein G6F57_019877 [Rhizopus arrhizus]